MAARLLSRISWCVKSVRAQYLHFHLAVWLKTFRDSSLKKTTCKFEFEFDSISNLVSWLLSCISWNDIFNTLLLYFLENYKDLSLFIHVHGTPVVIFKLDPNSKMTGRWPFAHLKFCLGAVSPFLFGGMTWNIQGLVTFKQAPASLNLSLNWNPIWLPGCHLVFSGIIF